MYNDDYMSAQNMYVKGYTSNDNMHMKYSQSTTVIMKLNYRHII